MGLKSKNTFRGFVKGLGQGFFGFLICPLTAFTRSLSLVSLGLSVQAIAFSNWGKSDLETANAKLLRSRPSRRVDSEVRLKITAKTSPSSTNSLKSSERISLSCKISKLDSFQSCPDWTHMAEKTLIKSVFCLSPLTIFSFLKCQTSSGCKKTARSFSKNALCSATSFQTSLAISA